MQPIISGKPGVRTAIATALGARDGRNRYIEGNGLTAFWCIGRLMGPVDAGSYDERFKKWRCDDLPILPDK